MPRQRIYKQVYAASKSSPRVRPSGMLQVNTLNRSQSREIRTANNCPSARTSGTIPTIPHHHKDSPVLRTGTDASKTIPRMMRNILPKPPTFVLITFP